MYIEYNGEVKDLLAVCLLTMKMHRHTMKYCVGHTLDHGMQLTYKTHKTAKLLILVLIIQGPSWNILNMCLFESSTQDTGLLFTKYVSSAVDSAFLDGLDLEMEPDEGEHQALQVLQGRLFK